MKKPHVTGLIDLLNKPALLKWANRLGLDGQDIDEYKSKIFKHGINKHKEVEDYFMGGILPEDPSRQEMIMSAFDGIDVIGMEESFEAEKYIGRVDIRFTKGGSKYIGDFKSKFKRAYMEHYLQLIAYKMHFGADKICIIDLRDFKIHELDLKDELIYQSIIENLINIYNLKQQL